jgi:integrase
MQAMKRQARKTRYPGVYQVGPTTFRIRIVETDPLTRKTREVDRLVEGVSAPEASALRARWRAGGEAAPAATRRTTVRAFARLWIESKAATVGRGTAIRYADALEGHILPGLGDQVLEELRPADVQAWVNDITRPGARGAARSYSVETARGWFRVLRTMVRDAVVQLDLPRDPTARVTFPERPELEERNALQPDELARFLREMEARYPDLYALTATLAFTGLRFCHASALRWEDVDEAGGVLRVSRRAYRGDVAPVSRRKRAPRLVPLTPELAAILKEHRLRLVATQHPGVTSGWVFPGETGKPKMSTAIGKAWRACLAAAGIDERFTVHGLRRTFNDLARRAGVDGVVTRSLTGHVTERMTEHYSTVGEDERRGAAVAVLRLVHPEISGVLSGDGEPEKTKAG